MSESPASDDQVDLAKLESKVKGIYQDVLAPLATPYAFELPVKTGSATGLPTVLLLGNHSSGKSSFINYVVGSDIQKTGLAPIDDGFTIIKQGPSTEDLDGQTVTSHPQLPFQGLERHGSAFVRRLRLKIRPDILLEDIILIDSPGMIDVANSKSERDYDFTATVKSFAELADLIIFFFDPDKPGTTGETLHVFTNALSGLEHKLLIVMNKVDRFAHIRDFARAYGALCWNLAKVIHHKDLPHIYTIYTPGTVEGDLSAMTTLPLGDFDASREEIIEEIRRSPSRRADNLVSAVYEHGRMLQMHTKVCSEARRQILVNRLSFGGMALASGLLTAGLLYGTLVMDLDPAFTIGVGIAGFIITAVAVLVGRYTGKRLKADIIAGLDAVFERAYARDLALGDRQDLKTLWSSVKGRTQRALTAVGPGRMPLLIRNQGKKAKLDRTLESAIPKLRRKLPGVKD